MTRLPKYLQGKNPKTLLEVFEDMEGFHPPERIMTTERVAKILRKSSMKDRFPELEIITVPWVEQFLSDLQKHDED
tara:strand:- start:1 stop:228 length:228 start_codon:yes stop_codon:yes gene_type:complete